ncbi:hypothetical protein [Flagellimonas marina]|uniref:Uncharacterized protein n=1 Tax=Flagellimonas marina TaxID=1775168 RepID=A0ABV8PJH5_9FLAO
MESTELKSKIETLVAEAKESGSENIEVALYAGDTQEFFEFLKHNELIEEVKFSHRLTIEQAEKLLSILGEENGGPTAKKESTGPKEEKGQEGKAKEKPVSEFAQKIAKDLEHRRQKATRESPAFGKKIPQIKVEPVDVQNALDVVEGVTDGFIDQFGFLTHVYRNAAARTETDITKIETGLFVKFE